MKHEKTKEDLCKDAMHTIKNYDYTNMLHHISSYENMQILEELVAKESEHCLDIRSRKPKFSKRVPRKHLEETLEEVKAHVDEFLDTQMNKIETCEVNYPGIFGIHKEKRIAEVKSRFPIKKDIKTLAGTASITLAGTAALLTNGNITLGQIIGLLGVASIPMALRMIRNNWLAHTERYVGYYYPLIKEIVITRDLRESLIPILAHEYTHHINNTLVYDMFLYDTFYSGIKDYEAFNEGLAMGAERHIARKYSENEENEAFEYFQSHHSIMTLSRAYEWLCGKSGKTPRKNKCVTISNPIRLDQYDVGNAYFRIESANKGDTAYKDALHELKEALRYQSSERSEATA